MKISYPVSPWDPSSVGFVGPKRRLVVDGPDYRLIPALRSAAQTKNPITMLARAAAEFFRAWQATTLAELQERAELGTALADLAVTGRDSYGGFELWNRRLTADPATLTELETATRNELAADGFTLSDAGVRAAYDEALDRAYSVAWALRGPVALRTAMRPTLGWIAVSGEDDKPHRPVNVPAPPYEQHEVQVVLAGGLWTRFFIASADAAPAPAQTFNPRRLPAEPPFPTIPSDHDVILFLHGHSSGAEEAVEFIPHLIQTGLERGKQYSVIAFDLPNNGYSETFRHTDVAAEDDTTYPHLPTDSGPIGTPILTFIDDFIEAFVERLEATMTYGAAAGPSIRNRISVIGGSLGGNLGLRLGRRTAGTWRPRAVAAWSAASVWMPMVQNTSRSNGPKHCMVEYKKPEDDGSRADYFHQVYDRQPLPAVIKQQPEYWYRDGFDAKEFQVRLSRYARHEIYNENYRQWHWRVACEQLIYSHFDNIRHGVGSDAKFYENITARTLLIAGEDDNYPFVGIYDGTKTLGAAMTTTEGRLLLIKDAGHSIHFEHPRFLAYEIVKFLNARSMEITCVTREEGHIARVGGTNVSDGTTFNLTLAECIAAIARGDEFYVTGSGGEQVMVRVIQGPESREYLRSIADDVEGNNLDLLPGC